MLRKIVVKWLGFNIGMHLAFLDPEKAFDKLERETLWEIMYISR